MVNFVVIHDEKEMDMREYGLVEGKIDKGYIGFID